MVHHAADAPRLVRRLHEQVVVVETGPGQFLQRLEFLLVRRAARDIHFEHPVIVLRPGPGNDDAFHVFIAREVDELRVRAEAPGRVVHDESPGVALLIALVDERHHKVFRQRFDAEQFAVDRDAVPAVAHHVLHAEHVHVLDRHAMAPPGGDAQHMPRFPQFLQGAHGAFRHVRILVPAGCQRAVYVKKQVSFLHVRFSFEQRTSFFRSRLVQFPGTVYHKLHVKKDRFCGPFRVPYYLPALAFAAAAEAEASAAFVTSGMTPARPSTTLYLTPLYSTVPL